MPDAKPCPMCDGGDLVSSEGRLDQSGHTYLPTTLWTCRCGYARYEPASGRHWKSLEEEPAAAPGIAALLQRAA